MPARAVPPIYSFTRRPLRVEVPEGATLAHIFIAGASGGATGSEPGAEGMILAGTLAVRAGQSFQFFVGGQGGSIPSHDGGRVPSKGGWSASGFHGDSCLLHPECWAGSGGGATIVRRDGLLIAVAEGGRGAGECGGRGGGSGRTRAMGLWDVVVQPVISAGDGIAEIRFTVP
jgi:hypothetical protein